MAKKWVTGNPICARLFLKHYSDLDLPQVCVRCARLKGVIDPSPGTDFLSMAPPPRLG